VKSADPSSRSSKHIESYKDLRVYRTAFEAAMYSLVDQVRRASRSVCANIAEAWRKRRYEAHFVSKLSDAESEAEETRVWLEFSFRCGYVDESTTGELDEIYDRILGQIVTMITSSERWVVGP